MSLQVIIPYILSGISIYMMYLAGNKTKYAWKVGLMNQGLWLFWIIVSGTWGLLPLNLASWVMYYRNDSKWNKKEIIENE